MTCNDMVSQQADIFENQVANDICVNPYQPIPVTAAVANGGTQQQSIVLPIVLIILAIVLCLGCIVGVPIVAYIFKKKQNEKEFTDIKALDQEELDQDEEH